ncbi:MAG: hypothetical protein KJ556_21420, partial [Gammaproteobacteria bacterium]|nr:hypothetical protein [Gammaproteobacteria bacterium]
MIATGLTMADSQVITLGTGSDATIQWDTAKLDFDAAAINFDGDTTVESGHTLTITSGAFTYTAGDLTMSDGSITITDADDASTLSITNNSAIGSSVNLIDINDSGTVTGHIIDVAAAGTTTGVLLYLAAATGTLTGAGKYIECYDGAADEFSVGVDGATVITTSANSTKALSITGIQTSEFLAVLDNTAGVIASDKAVLKLDAGGNMAAGSNILRIEATGTPVATSKAIEIVGTGKNIQAFEADVDVTGTNAVQVTGSGVLTTGSLLYLGLDATPTAGTAAIATIQYVSETGAAGSGAILLDLDGSTSAMSAIKAVVNNTTTNAVSISGAGVLSAAHMLYVNSDASGTVAGDSIVQFKASPTYSGIGTILELYGYAKRVTGLRVATGNTTTHAVDIDGSGALASGGVMLKVDNAGTPAATTDSVCLFTFTGTATNKPRIVEITGTGKDAGGLYLDTDNTTTHAVSVTGSGTLNAGNLLYVDTDVTPTAASDNLVQFKMNTGTGCVSQGTILDLVGTDKTVSAITADTDNTTTNAVAITGSGVLNGGHMLYVNSDASGTAVGDSLVQFKATPTYSGIGMLLDLYALGKTMSAIKSVTGNTTTHAVDIDGSGALAAGNMLYVTNAGTPAANTDAVVNFSFTGTATNNPIVLEVDNSTKDAQPLHA